MNVISTDEKRRIEVETIVERDWSYFSVMIDSDSSIGRIPQPLRQFENENSEEGVQYKKHLEQIEKDKDFMDSFLDEFNVKIESNTIFRTLTLEQVLKWSKDNSIEQYPQYEESLKLDEANKKLYEQALKELQNVQKQQLKDKKDPATVTAEYEQNCEKEKQSLDVKNRESELKRHVLVAKMYKAMYESIVQNTRDLREKDKKEKLAQLQQEELKRQKEAEKRASRSRPRSRAKSVPNGEEAPETTEIEPEKPAAVVEDLIPRPEIIIVLKNYPRTLDEMEALAKETHFDAIIVLSKDAKRGPPPKLPPAAEEATSQKGKKKDNKKKPKPDAKKKKPQSKDKKNAEVEIIPDPLYVHLQREQQKLKDANLASVLRDILFLQHSVIEYTYDQENQKFDDGLDIEAEVERILQLFEDNIVTLTKHFDQQPPRTSKPKYIKTHDPATDITTAYYNKLLQSVPDASITVPIVLYCMIEQIVRSMEENTGVNKDDKKLIEFNENMSSILDNVFSKLDNLSESVVLDDTNSNNTNNNTVINSNTAKLLPYGDKRHFNTLYPSTIQSLPTSDIENRLSKMFPVFSATLKVLSNDKVGSNIPMVRTTEERGSRLTELYHFMSAEIRDGERTSPELIEKELVTIHFEDLMSQHTNEQWNFEQRVFKEEFNSETFVQMLRELTLLNTYHQYSSYYDLEDSVLFIYHKNIPSSLFIEYSFVKDVSTFIYYIRC
jgi:hypothetical protein